MGDIAVDIFLETLKQLITSSKLRLIIEEKHQLQSLEEEIKYLRGFLKLTEKIRNDYPEVMKLVVQIRDLVAKAENIVELFVVHAFKADHLPIKTKKKKKKRKENNKQHQMHLSLENAKKVDHAHYSLSGHQDHALFDFYKVMGQRILMFIKEMKTLTAEVNKIYNENMYNINGVVVKQFKHSSAGSGGIGSSRGSRTSKIVEEEVVWGFEDEVYRIIEKLDDSGEGRPLEIISIIGSGGAGKTTLAKKVYHHPFMLHTFDIHAWIDVSQDYDKTRKRDLLIRILESLIPGNHQNSSDDKLGEDILKCLKGRKYLIVMDDVWGIEAWNDIQRSFPKECKGSKVLFTSRLLIKLDSIGYFPHYMNPLPKHHCWELLQKKVFGIKCCPPELVDIGKKIAEKCLGLPLAVVTIAGILATEDKTLDMWTKVAKQLSSIIAKNGEGCMEILELSYNHLPLHLKACFLYIGGYPEDKEIPVRELIWLWIAEGFIQQSDGGKSLETIAKDYLVGLIDRSLVQVARKSPLGGIKTCRIHDLLRALCLKIAEEDNFLVRVFEDDFLSPSGTNKHRRVFIDSQFFQKFSLRPRNLRSFLCLSLRESYQSKVAIDLSFDVENFELLRVWSFMSGTCYGGRGLLVHLRYLAYHFGEVSHGFSFSNLLNLETLNLDVPYINGTIPLPCDIFKMVKLRHLYTKHGVFKFDHSSEETGGNDFDHSSKLDSLQTLHQVCACQACRSLLVRTPNLRKLGLHICMIPEDNNVLRFPDLESFKCLEKLTFSAYFRFYSTGESILPPGLKLPLTITQITFNCTHLKWEELSLLQNLPSLEVLKLIEYACAGPVWNTSELEGFPQLKYLRFYLLDIKEWIASEDEFPKLEVLVLEHCYKLEQIPIDFGNLNELREIKLVECRRSVKESAWKIREEQRNRKGDDDCLNLISTRRGID